jgi:hypothetical protein
MKKMQERQLRTSTADFTPDDHFTVNYPQLQILVKLVADNMKILNVLVVDFVILCILNLFQRCSKESCIKDRGCLLKL